MLITWNGEIFYVEKDDGGGYLACRGYSFKFNVWFKKLLVHKSEMAISYGIKK